MARQYTMQRLLRAYTTKEVVNKPLIPLNLFVTNARKLEIRRQTFHKSRYLHCGVKYPNLRRKDATEIFAALNFAAGICRQRLTNVAIL